MEKHLLKCRGTPWHHRGKYRCHLCPKKFVSPKVLQGHILRHSEEVKYPCDFCDIIFSDQLSVFAHIQEDHDGADNVKSKGSNMVFIPNEEFDSGSSESEPETDNDDFKRRRIDIKTEDGNSERGMYKCFLCIASYSMDWELNSHIKRTHQTKKRGVFKCPVCYSYYPNARLIKRHMADKHGFKEKRRSTTNNGAIRRSVGRPRKLFKEEPEEVNVKNDEDETNYEIEYDNVVEGVNETLFTTAEVIEDPAGYVDSVDIHDVIDIAANQNILDPTEAVSFQDDNVNDITANHNIVEPTEAVAFQDDNVNDIAAHDNFDNVEEFNNEVDNADEDCILGF